MHLNRYVYIQIYTHKLINQLIDFAVQSILSIPSISPILSISPFEYVWSSFCIFSIVRIYPDGLCVCACMPSYASISMASECQSNQLTANSRTMFPILRQYSLSCASFTPAIAAWSQMVIPPASSKRPRFVSPYAWGIHDEFQRLSSWDMFYHHYIPNIGWWCLRMVHRGWWWLIWWEAMIDNGWFWLKRWLMMANDGYWRFISANMMANHG